MSVSGSNEHKARLPVMPEVGRAASGVDKRKNEELLVTCKASGRF